MPSSSGSTYSAGTLKFLKLQVGSVETISAPTTTSSTPDTAAWRIAAAIASHSHSWKASAAKIGNSARPAPAGAGTPVKKLCAKAGFGGGPTIGTAGGTASPSAALKR